jgi:transaldolase
LLNSGTLERYVDELSMTGLTSNPTISERLYELAAKLQDEGAKLFVNSWNELMDVIASKTSKLAKAS